MAKLKDENENCHQAATQSNESIRMSSSMSGGSPEVTSPASSRSIHHSHQRSLSHASKPQVECAKFHSQSSARRKLFPPPASSTNSTGELPSNNKWWPSCWNGAQLDGELLFEQVRAHRRLEERRLLMAGELIEGQRKNHHFSSKSMTSDRGGQSSCSVYAVPRSSLASAAAAVEVNRLPPAGFDAKTVDKITATQTDEDEEDPLSDPLYASVLGTSKQLKQVAISRRNNQREAKSPSQVDMSSLVESCLEVKRATRNGNLLLITNSKNEEFTSASQSQALTSQDDSSLTAAAANGARNASPSLQNSDQDDDDGDSSSVFESSLEVSLLHLSNGARRESSQKQQQRRQQAAADEQTGGRAATAAASAHQNGGCGHGADTSQEMESVQEDEERAMKMKSCPPGRDNDTTNHRAHQSDTSFELAAPPAATATTNLARPAAAVDLSNTPTLKFAAPTTSGTAAARELSCQATAGRESDAAAADQTARVDTVESRPLEREQLETQQARADMESQQAKDANLAINPTAAAASQSGDADEQDERHHSSNHEIFIESAWSLEQKLKESPIRVREISSREASEPLVVSAAAPITAAAAIMWSPADELMIGRPEGQASVGSNYDYDECQDDKQQVARFFESHKGKEWRTRQLDYQIPRQDIKLLAMPPGGAHQSATSKRDNLESSDKGKHQTIGDEIKFIRGQQKAASQFKASLYYLNPCISSGQDATQRTTTTTTTTTAKDAKNSHQRLREQNTDCFKCKKSIESGTTCVRVDNLMQDEVRTRKQHEEGEEEAAVLVPNAAGKEAKCSSHENNQQNDHLRQQTREAIFQISNGDEDERCGKANKENITKSESEKSSSDEGLGSGTSSQSNSAAGSHCDDRETPPHIDHHHHLHHDQDDKRPADPTTTTTTCDTNHLNEISSDSLEVSKSTGAGKTKAHKRHKSIGGGGEKNGKLFSRKNRALTWSASLGSLGASLKFGASCTSSSAKSRSDTNLQARDDEHEVATSHSEVKPIAEPKASDDTQPIFFHTDCFSCATCHEVLVDLRALIYVNDSGPPSGRCKGSKASAKQDTNAADSEYINLPQDSEPTSQVEDANEDNQQQISLYCHRHFVELFKPRCQQCDCLILDEECTEAEGKVWHIKHFCCAECKVPLGGHQYIIVDQALEQARHQRRSHSHAANGAKTPATGGAAAPTTTNSQPYCLGCFDKNFGETCVACHQLITCDSGAINHEQRSWHASARCFRCAHCLRSLLGCPFLPSSQDGRIYCSVRCSDQMVASAGGRTNPLAVPPKPSAAQVQNLSLAHYLDPRAMPSAIQHDLELNKSTGGPKGAPSRHKQLVDYLVANARTDETSYQLLRYLQVKLEKGLAEGPAGGRQDRELADRIAQTLAVLERERAAASDQERARRNKLNPFLVDLDSQQQHNQTKRPFMEPQDRLVCMMMDRVLDETSAQFQQQQQRQDNSKLQDYINLDCLAPLTVNSKLPRAGSGSRGAATAAAANAQNRLGGALHTSKLSQCSPVASLISNEGTISDHSATSSGVSTAPPGNGSANGSLKSHSPLSSTSSHDSSTSSSGGGGGGLHHRQASSCSGGTAASANNHQPPLRASPAINSIAASLERRRRVQPITELSVVDLLTVADQVDHHQPFMGQYNQPTKAVTPPGGADGFDQLVSQFGSVSNGSVTSGAPVTAALKKQQQQQQQKGGFRLPFGASSCVANRAGKQQNQTGGGKQQPDSFFFELAQRLPRAARGLVPTASGETHPQQTSGTVQVATSGPLDTNGLPTIDSETSSSACESGAPAARTITDHYSTVNKAHKQQQQQQHQQRQMADERDRRTRDNFFAITSPLLECQVDAPLTSTSGSQLALNGAGAGNSKPHPSQLARPTSSLSIFAGDNNGAHQHQLGLHGSYSTSSLNRGQQQPLHQQAATPTTTTMNQQQQQQQKPLTRPAKSVSFDPNVKDPPSSSTMTLGRAATLKSALKQTQQQQQQQLAWQQQLEMLAAAEMQAHMPAAASSATMPASFAAQLKAASGSLAAYSAHYDEFGRRIKLSTLQQLQQLQQQQQLQFVNQDSNLPQDDNQTGSKLASLPGGSLLAKLGSRGGRREERKMRQEQQQQLPAAGGPVLAQPGSLPVLANNDHLLMPSTSGAQQQSLIIEAHDVSPAASSSRRSSHSVGSSSSRRGASSRRTSGSHKHSSRRSASTQNRRRRAPRAPVCKSRNCRDPKCLYDDTEDEDNYSSSCSTCSSSQSYDDESEDDRRPPRNHRRRYNSRRRHGRNHRAGSRSQSRHVSTTSSSECDSYSDDDYSDDVYDSDDASSYTSYTSASGSDSEDDEAVNPTAQGKVDDDDEENGGAYADEDQQSCSSTSSGEAHRNRSSSRRRRESARSAPANRSRSSRSSDSTLVSNRSSSSSRARRVDRRNRDRIQRRPSDNHHQRQRTSHRLASTADRHQHSRSRRSSNSSGRSDQHQRRARNHHHHHHNHQRQSSAHLEPQTPVAAAAQMPSADVMHPELQLLHARNQLTATNLVRSSSSMSNDSKTARDESCRII